MTVIFAESGCGTGDPGAADTTGSGGAYLTHTAGLVHRTAGMPRPVPSVEPSDAAGPHTPTPAAELTAQFERDAIPLSAPLYRRALRMTHNRADAEDLVQDTMMCAYAGFHSFRQNSNLNAWLHRILTNVYVSGCRKKQRRAVQYPTGQITDQELAANAAHSSLGLRSAGGARNRAGQPDQSCDACPARTHPHGGVLRRRRRSPIQRDCRNHAQPARNSELAAAPRATAAAPRTGQTHRRNELYHNRTREIYVMKRSNAGPGWFKRAGAEQVNAALVRLLIADALAQLSAEHRAVICRSYYLGWTTAQIAEDLQIAECTVISRLHFALRALRLTLQGSPAALHSAPGPATPARRCAALPAGAG